MPNWVKYRSEQAKRARSEKASRAANARWEQYHACLSDQPIMQDLPDDCFRITVENLITKKTEVLLFHPGGKSGRFHIDVNGKYWKTCGWTDATVRIRKSCKRMFNPRII
jgi:hypothetical protein